VGDITDFFNAVFRVYGYCHYHPIPFFCCGNTIVAYGAFTEALHIWQAAKVSAVLAMGPIFTFLSMLVVVKWLPQHFTASHVDQWAYIGAAVVVIGSALTALGRAKVP
jgi:drug/metabolite transporter (DMT)-like permease